MSDAATATVPDGVDPGAVRSWLASRAEVVGDLSFALIPGGRSNLTFTVTDEAGHRWVLRRPPLGKVLASAHDMGREHRIIAALADSAVPVPTVVGLDASSEVMGAPFYVMDFVEGHVLRDVATAEALLEPADRRRASESIVDTLAAIHAVDLDAVGLHDLGKKSDYLARQLHRWYGQFQNGEIGPVPSVDRVHDKMVSDLPTQRGATIVHGDYRLDNCMLGDDGTVVAVLDWEICTLGDPLADVGLLHVYWADPDDPFAALGAGPTTSEGFLRKAQLLERYAAATGRDLDGIGTYIAFGYWKLACILTGVATRYAAGVMGDESGDELTQGFIGLVHQLGEAAEAALEERG